MINKLNDIGTGTAGVIGSITMLQVQWFNTSAVHDIAGALAQLAIAFVTIYSLYKRNKKNDETGT